MTEQKRMSNKPLKQGANRDKAGKQPALKKSRKSIISRATDNRWFFILPLMFVAAIVPLIVYVKAVPLHGEAFLAWTGEPYNADFFSYYKGIWLEVAAVVSIGLLLLKVLMDGTRSLRWTYLFVPVAAFCLLTIFSALYSRYPEIAYSGFPDRYEGLWVLLAYMVMLVFAVTMIKGERQLSLVLGAVFAGAVVIGLIGVFQYFGLDILKAGWVKQMILPAQLAKDAGNIKFQFGAHTIYATLFHYDYVGSYTAMLFPLSFALFILEGQRKRKALLGLLSALMAFTWLGCNSRAGMFGGALGLILLLVMLRQYIVRYWKYIGLGLVLLVILIIGLDRLSNGYLGQRLNSLMVDAASLAGGKVAQAGELPLKDVQIIRDSAKIVTQDGTLNMTFSNDQIYFTDQTGKPLQAVHGSDKGVISIQDSRYSKFQIRTGLLNNRKAIIIQDGVIRLFFGADQDHLVFLDNKGSVIPLQRPPAWGFQGMERIGSARGYIWSRSLPLLAHKLWLGYGPDTFAAYFPQYDIYGKMYAYYGDMWQLVDKPHDFYLQTAINTGFLSLLALLTLFGMYLVDCFRIYSWGGVDSKVSRIGVGIMVGVTGYLGAAFFNDSVVSVAPVFWILLGLGIAANSMAHRAAVNK